MNLRHAPTVVLVLAACAPSRKAESGPEAAVFTATDFAFAGPDTIAPGITRIRLVNHGTQPHHLILGRLDPGKTLADLVADYRANPNVDPPYTTWHGAVSAVEAGDSAGSIVELSPGHYVVMCFMPDPADNQMHFTKGMSRDLVVAGTPTATLAPSTDGRIELVDFSFVAPDLTAGTHTLEVVNHGTQTHEAQLIRLNPGATVEAFMAALAPGATAPPPGVLLGGSGALSPGVHSYWPVTLTPGNYLLVCFVPDSTGAPHAAKGMIRSFSIPS
jgi:hypothetical protein